MKSRISLLGLMAIVFACTMNAAPISIQRATEIANVFLSPSIAPTAPNRAPMRPRLMHTATPQAAYYIFENENGGFIIVAGDDVAYPILGYSNQASPAAKGMPDNTKAWLALYAAEIQNAVDSGIAQSPAVRQAWDNIAAYANASVVVSPLILTRWNQSPYYNDLCPMDVARNERTVVGCVATAMAQVLKYWEHPINGNGSYTYTHEHGVQSANFAATTYKWANMPLEVTAASTDAQKAEVAQLMYHCGVSVEMDYDISSRGGSGAFTISSKSNTTHCAEYALREYWGYKPTLQGLQKAKFKDDEWKKMLKDDLNAGRPIIYSGYGDGGHCFVCDGYNSDDYFHFNWGWGGLYDGYFLLNALEPGTGGTGSGGGTYNNDQQAIFGLEPLKSIDDDTSAKDLHLASMISISSSEILYKEGFSISAAVKNGASTLFDGQLGMALYDANLELITVIDAQSATLTAGETANFTFATTSTSELLAGLYYAAIYSKTASTDWKSIGAGNFRNMVQFRINTDPCGGNIVYECDFEGDLMGWTFAKAPGIKSGFAVGSAMKYKGEKSLYISPDGGTTVGYTQDNDKGYVSVAYRKVYLEAGNYVVDYNFHMQLKYLDVDVDQIHIALVPTTNTIEPLNYYENNIPFLNNYGWKGQCYESSSWGSNISTNATITNTGMYYLVLAFAANEYEGKNQHIAFDNISIKRKGSLNYKETLDGVQFNWEGGYPAYRIRWSNWCDSKYHYDTIQTNSYFIPYTQLRDAIYDYSLSYSFYVTPICEGGKTSNDISVFFIVKTEPFPADTCIAVPTNLKAENTANGVKLSWKGNADAYDIRYGTNSAGCDCVDTIHNMSGTTYTIPYTTTSGLKDGGHYFLVRGLCANDTSIWQKVYLDVKAPDGCTSDDCLAKPCNLFAQNMAEGITLTWRGNADKYEIECRSEDEYYRRGNIYEYNDSNYVRFMANDSIYVIPYNTLSDTLYHFRVRTICGQDTSFWTDYISAYNINFGEYCIPFYDLCGPNTLCTYGSYSYPYSTKKTLDFRQKDWRESYYKGRYNYEKGERYGVYGTYPSNGNFYRSRHTICFEGETDPRCDNQLSTVPEGEKYSMRLGNWHNGEGESVTFTHTIDSGYPLILLLKYAVVLQDPSHTSAENPHFTLEILDENDKLLDPVCWYADFAADKNATGWKNAVNAHEPTSEEYRNVVWKDWTTIGVNLSDLSQYGDRTIKIRLTTKDCTRGQHYGYAYFTLSCTTADMRGMSCGVRPQEFEVAEGFKYNWYLMDDPTKATVCDSNVFIVQPTDTNSYHVDLISLENSDCYFTLNAYTLPRLPRAQATFKHTPHDCINEVVIDNTSYVYKIMLDKTEQLDGRIHIDSIQWDFGEYGTSTEWNPTLIIPNQGDTFNVSLRVVANACSEIQQYTLSIPAIRDTTTLAHRYLCEGDTLHYSSKQYYAEGVYTDTLKRTYGCDSIHILTVEYLRPEYKHYYDTICEEETPYVFFGKPYSQTGIYEEHIPSSLGCDTIIHQLHLSVLTAIQVTIGNIDEYSREIGEFIVPHTVQKGVVSGYSIDFSDEANNNGFIDIINDTIHQNVRIVVPPTCSAQQYQAIIRFHNNQCAAVEIPIQFTVTMFSKPESKATFTHAPHDCINQVRITNQSAVYKHYNDSIKTIDPTQTIDSYSWDLGKYGTSALAEPELIVAAQGDTFTVALTTTYGTYSHTEQYTLEIPAIIEQDGYQYVYICEGEDFDFEGKKYNTPGQYILDVVTNQYGCDSTSYIIIDYLQSEIVDQYDTICYTELPYNFHGQSCTQAGTYDHAIIAQGGCDSITYRMHLFVYEELKLTLNTLPEICAGDPSFDITYTEQSGTPSAYKVQFSNEAKKAGFTDSNGVIDNTKTLTISLPAQVHVDTYSAQIIFDNHGCADYTIPLTFDVHYAREVVAQRWNDVLAVKNDRYNGGYSFVAFQWYKDGTPIQGETHSYLYQPLDMNALYHVLLTRADGLIMPTCPIQPIHHTDITDFPTLLQPGQQVPIKLPLAAEIWIYSVTGQLYQSGRLSAGENIVTMPFTMGVYTVKILLADGNHRITKIMVSE